MSISRELLERYASTFHANEISLLDQMNWIKKTRKRLESLEPAEVANVTDVAQWIELAYFLGLRGRKLADRINRPMVQII